jgi:uncharacterized protein YyaL (SSP411 family)
LTVRATRVRPGTDDKILTSWNGLMLAALAEAARALESNDYASSSLHSAQRDRYINLATRNADFLLKELRPDGKLKHSWRNGKTTNEVFLEDYAALILGLLELYQTDFKDKWFASAKLLADEMIELFEDPNGGFFDTSKEGEALLLRPKDVQDNATPSGNALACEALLKLSEFTGDGKYRDHAEKSLRLVVGMATRYPTAFGRWLSAADMALGNTKQVAVVYEANKQDEAKKLIQAVRSQFRPDVIVAASAYPPSENAPDLLNDRPLKDGKSTVYVCEGFVCKNPVTTVEDLKQLL